MPFKRIAILAAICWPMLTAYGHAATLTVVNQSDSYVTISVDGAYGCNTAGHTTCTIPVSEGTHALKAVRSDNGSSTSLTATVPAAEYRWTLFNVTGGGASNACVARARAFEAKVDNFNRRCTGARSISQAALYQSCASEKAALAAEQNRICSECPGCQR